MVSHAEFVQMQAVNILYASRTFLGMKVRYNVCMELIWYVLVFVFGAIIGSFLNVVIYRMHTGRSLNGRSHCMSCGTHLTWYELFPVVSYLVQRAKCRTCTAYIPWRYLLVEVLTASVFLLLYTLYHSDLVLLALHFVLAALLIVILVYDIRHTIIPDELTIGVSATAVVLLAYHLMHTKDVWGMVYDLFGGICAALFFAGLWYISKGRWVGLGDAKIALPLGVVAGVASVFSMVVLSFWIGAVVSVSLLMLQRILKRGKKTLPFLPTPLTIKSEVPFAPFLIAGFACAHFFHVDIFTITFFFLPF